MARLPSATALLLLSLSLLAVVAHCRTVESEPSATDAASTAETGPPNPTVVQTEAVPAEQEQDVVLRLPSHRSHRHPCRHDGHRHHRLWWPRHHGGLLGDGHDGEPNRAKEVKAVAEPDPDRSLPDSDDGDGERVKNHFRRDGHDEAPLKRWRTFRHGLRRSSGGRFGDGNDGEPNRAAKAAKDEEMKVEPVAEPDPDRSLPESDDGEGELVRKPFRDGHDEATPSLKRWRMFRHGLRRHHHEDEKEEEEEESARGVKRFRHRDHDDDDEEEDEEKEKKTRKLVHHHHHDDDEEGNIRKPFRYRHEDDEDEDLEEMVRRLRKAIFRGRFRHGRFVFRHHHRGHRYHHANKEVNEQSDGEQQQQQREDDGGVMTWIKGLINRF